MKTHWPLAVLVSLTTALMPAAGFAQNVNVTRSILPDQPYTLIYPEPMVASGGAGEPVTVNHPNAPLQCTMVVVPVEDTAWSAETALAELGDSEVNAAWGETLPGFALGAKATTAYQDATALLYDGASTDSPMGVPLTLVHTETVTNGRGYVLDCMFATEVAAQARPIVDFIIANFATRSDANCCVGAEVMPDEPVSQ
ncbi:MAG: hypothetical protein KIT02_05265 [Devosia sp.]|uniref:hypothetical protein n=1 Tax=Devosia sp. TaxID=1871048 RepID=UPI0024CCE15D|nr:hypothetical protein [Devosia sp.]UYO00625.1 MAG: hypothetical protein KIT02_05265 [Devosia sp.]